MGTDGWDRREIASQRPQAPAQPVDLVLATDVFVGGIAISNPTNGEGSAPATNKYARRGDIVFIGSGAALVIGLCIVGGLAYFDTFHASPPKPVAEKPTPPSVAEKPTPPLVAEKSSPPAVAEKPALVPPPASPSDAGTAAPAELPAVPPAEPASAPAMADDPSKPAEAQPKPQTPLESEQQVVTTDQTRRGLTTRSILSPPT